MTGLEKMIAAILEEAGKEAQATLAKARAEAEQTLAEEKAKSDALCAEIEENANRQAAEIERACISAARLRQRKGLLEARQALLAEVMEQALERVYAMPEGAYFELLVEMAAALAEPGEGEILLNGKDLARRPKAFEADLNAALQAGAKLRLSDHAQPIDGGFVLKYGDIEQNCSFRAIFTARSDEMSDRARGILFS